MRIVLTTFLALALGAFNAAQAAEPFFAMNPVPKWLEGKWARGSVASCSRHFYQLRGHVWHEVVERSWYREEIFYTNFLLDTLRPGVVKLTSYGIGSSMRFERLSADRIKIIGATIVDGYSVTLRGPGTGSPEEPPKNTSGEYVRCPAAAIPTTLAVPLKGTQRDEKAWFRGVWIANNGADRCLAGSSREYFIFGARSLTIVEGIGRRAGDRLLFQAVPPPRKGLGGISQTSLVRFKSVSVVRRSPKAFALRINGIPKAKVHSHLLFDLSEVKAFTRHGPGRMKYDGFLLWLWRCPR